MMLEINKKLFEKLKKYKIKYVIYKGLSHLEEDLRGERGDIDIIVKKSDFDKFYRLSNFNLTVTTKNNPFYFIGLDIKTYKLIMLDVSTKIIFGKKPYKSFYIENNLDKLNTKDINGLYALNDNDYIPLMFLIRVVSLSEKKENLLELQGLLKEIGNINGYMKNLVENITNTEWKEIQKDILRTENWRELKDKYERTIVKNVKKDYKKLFRQKFKWFFAKLKTIERKIFKIPSYRIRKKGYLVAFMGNDGAGKSSTINFIKNLGYFKLTGIEVIYFGNNQYVIPFLNSITKNVYKNKFINIALRVLSSLDKKIRALIAKYYINTGCLVLADRYFYDELMAIEYNSYKETNNILKKMYRWITMPSLLIKPEITIFLDVDPEIAYQRKQDYDLETVRLNVKRYREFLSKFDEVVKIDANQAQEKVINEIIKKIYEKDIEINNKLFYKSLH